MVLVSERQVQTEADNTVHQWASCATGPSQRKMLEEKEDEEEEEEAGWSLGHGSQAWIQAMMQPRSLAALACEDAAPRLMAVAGEGRGGKSPCVHSHLPHLGCEHGGLTCKPPIPESPPPQTRLQCQVVEPHEGLCSHLGTSSKQAAPRLLQSRSEYLQGQRFPSLSRPLFQYLSTLKAAS